MIINKVGFEKPKGNWKLTGKERNSPIYQNEVVNTARNHRNDERWSYAKKSKVWGSGSEKLSAEKAGGLFLM